MEIQCPSCKKINPDSPECVRCGCELELLKTILQAAEKEVSLGMEKLETGNAGEALDHATRSWHLKKTTNAARLAFLANVAEKRYEDALQWHCRNKNHCHREED